MERAAETQILQKLPGPCAERRATAAPRAATALLGWCHGHSPRCGEQRPRKFSFFGAHKFGHGRNPLLPNFLPCRCYDTPQIPNPHESFKMAFGKLFTIPVSTQPPPNPGHGIEQQR